MTDVARLSKKAFTWSVVSATILWSMGAAALVPLVAQAAECPTLSAGAVVKVANNSAVYLINSDLKRMYFPSGEIYKTWFKDYSNVQTITPACLENYPTFLGNGVNYRPGSRLVKSVVTPSVYAVGPNNMRHKIASEAVAKELYGANWASLVRDVADVFMGNLADGSELASAKPHNGMLVKKSSSADVYVVKDGKLVKVDGALSTVASGDVRTVSDAVFASVEMASGTATPGSVVENPSQKAAGASAPVVSGSVSVSLAGDTPASATVARSATNIDVLKFNVKAGAEAVVLDDLTVKRSGLGSTSNLSAYVYDGDTRVGTAKTFATDTNDAEFSVLNITVPANSTKTLSIRIKTGDGTNHASGEHRFAVTALKAGNASVSGLPVSGNLFSVSSGTSAGSITIVPNGTLSNPTIGDKQATVAQFKLTAGTEDGMLHSFTLKQDGTLSNEMLSGYTLWQGTTAVPVTASVNGRRVSFTLGTPFKLVDGAGKIFTLKADVSSAADTGKTVVFFVENSNDIKAVGSSYGYGLLPAITSYDTAAESSTLTLQGGGVTISNLSGVAKDVKTDSTEVELAKVGIKAVSDTIEVQKMTLQLETTGATSSPYWYGTYRDENGTGSLGASETTLIRNIKLKDADTGKTVGSAKSISDASGLTSATSTLTFTYTDYFTVAKGSVRNVVVVADINSAQISGVVYKATLKFDSSSNFVVKDSKDNTVTDIVPASNLAGNNVTTRTSSLTVSRASSPESKTVVKGSTVDALGMIWATGSGAGNEVKISAVTLNTYVDADTSNGTYTLNTETETVATPANALVTEVSLVVDGKVIAGPVGIDSSGNAIFTSSKFVGGYYTLPAGSSKTVIVRAVTSGNAPYGSADDSFSFSLEAADITAEDANGSVTASVTGDSVNGTTSPSVAIDITASGVITTAADSGKPAAQVLVAGSSAEQEVNRVRISATKEKFVVNELTVNQSSSTAYDNIEYVQIYSTAGTRLGPEGGVSLDSSGNANFTGLSIEVPANGSTLVVVKAKLKAVGERTTAANGTAGTDADSGEYVTFRLSTTSGDFGAVGSSSGTSTLAATDAATGNSMLIRNSKPTVSVLTLPSAVLSSGERTIMKFSVTADVNADIILGSISPTIVMSDSDGSGELKMTTATLYLYDVTDSATLLNTLGANTTEVVATTTPSAAYDIDIDADKYVTIAAGATRTFEVRATFSGVETSDQIETRIVQDTAGITGLTNNSTFARSSSADAFTWSDTSGDTNGASSIEWSNSYLLKGWDTKTSVISKS